MRIHLIVSLALLLFSVVASAQITVNTNFDPRTNQPIDIRDTLTFLADTSAVTWTYSGLSTYAADADQFWYYNGSFWERLVQDPYLANLQDVDTTNIQIDDIAQWDGSNWIMTSPVELIGDGGGAFGSGLAGRTAYWLDDSTLVHTNITYSSTELNASALTGSFQWPTGTTAQRPVGANGKTRFNSTTGLFEGYHDAAYRPFATFDGTRTSGRIPYWDGEKLTSSSVLTFSGTTLGITQSSTTENAFKVSNGTTTYMRIQRNGSIFFNADGNGGNIQRNGGSGLLTNFYSGGGGADWLYQSNGSTFARIGSSGSTGNGYVRSKVFEPEGDNTLWIRGLQNSNNSNLSILIEGGYNSATNTSGGNIFIRGGSEGTALEGGYGGNPGEIFLQTRVDSNTTGVRGNILTGLYIPYVPAGRGRAWVSIGGTHSPTAVLDVNGNTRIRTMPDSISTYIAMADASGYIYRATPGDVVAAGSGSTNSIYNLLPTQDILIDPNANDLIIGSFGAGNSGDFEFFTTNEDGQYAGIFAGTRDSSWLATAGDGFQFDAALFSTGAEDGVVGVNYEYFGTVWNAAVFGDSMLLAPYPGSELNMTINGLPDDPVNPYKVMVQDTVTDRVYLTSIDSLLGSGTAGTLPIWNADGTLGNSSVTEASGVLSSSLTGALKLPAGTDAQDPVWSAGMLRYNTTASKYQVYNGSTEMFLPYWDGTGTLNRIPYWDGTKLISATNFTYDGSHRFKSGNSNNSFTGGSYGFIAGGQSNTVSGSGSVAMGSGNTVGQGYSVVAGISNSVSGGQYYGWIWGGESNSITNGQWNTIIGGSNNTIGEGVKGVIWGIGNSIDSPNGTQPNTITVQGEYARGEFPTSHNHASGRFSANGDAQYVRVLLRNTAINDSVTLGVNGDTLNLWCHTNYVYHFEAQIVAVATVSGGTVVADEVATYVRRFTIKRMTSGAPVILNIQTIGADYEESSMSGGAIFVKPFNSSWAQFEVGYIPPPGADANTRIRVVATLHGTKVNGT